MFFHSIKQTLKRLIQPQRTKTMVPTEYIRSAMEQAAYKHLPNDGVIYGEIPGFRGVYATGDTAEVCREKLEETLKDWAEFRLARGMAIPGFEGRARVVRA